MRDELSASADLLSWQAISEGNILWRDADIIALEFLSLVRVKAFGCQ